MTGTKSAVDLGALALRQLHRRYLVERLVDAQSDDDGPWSNIAQHLGHVPSTTLKHYVSAAQRAPSESAERARLAFAIAALTGLRIGEICSLRVEEAEPSLIPVETGKCLQSTGDTCAHVLDDGVECKPCKYAVFDSSVWEFPLPPATPLGLTRQYEELDRVSALSAHLNALDDQLAFVPPRASRTRRNRR